MTLIEVVLDFVSIILMIAAVYITYIYPLFHPNLKILIVHLFTSYIIGMAGRLFIILYQLGLIQIYCDFPFTSSFNTLQFRSN